MNQYDIYGVQRDELGEYGRKRRSTYSLGPKLANIKKKMEQSERRHQEKLQRIKEFTKLGMGVAQNIREVSDIRKGAEFAGIEMPERSLFGKLSDYTFGPSPTRQIPVSFEKLEEGFIGPPAPTKSISTGQLGTLGRISETAPSVGESLRRMFLDYTEF
jgi:hypothetical protein